MYAFQSGKFADSILIDVLTPEGYLVFKQAFRTYTGAKKYIEKKFGYVEWIGAPWGDQKILDAKAKYEKNWGLPYDGNLERERE